MLRPRLAPKQAAQGWADRRTSRHERGYGTAWDKLRTRILERDHGICQPCQGAGRLTLASQVDHIKPKADGGTDDEANLQAICKPCHDAKTAAESQRARGVGGVSFSGG